MSKSLRTFTIATLLPSALSVACGSTDSNSLDDESNVRIWATTASAVGVYSNAYGPIATADGRTNYDPACPLNHDDGVTLTLNGGCIDRSRKAWVGTATVVRSADGSRALTFDHFGAESKLSGSVNLDSLGAYQYRFIAHLTDEGGMTTHITYSGTVSGTYDAATTWSGSGHFERNGKLPPTGSIDATTVDEVVDNATCSGQPSSGSTTLHNGNQTAVITYDGATDCDSSQNAHWSVDGTERGLISGINCAVSSGVGRETHGPLAGLAAVALAALMRRRRDTARR